MNGSRNGSRNGQVDATPAPDPAPEQAIADLALRKAAAFDELARWLGDEIGVHWSTAMGPEWVLNMLRSNLRSRLEESRRLRAGRDGRPPVWLRRMGW